MCSHAVGLWIVFIDFMARSRTFMRSVAAEPKVGLLLFDEPSASLDPTAEHGDYIGFITFLIF